jgi:hypothetical protein
MSGCLFQRLSGHSELLNIGSICLSWLYFLHFRIKEVYSNAQLSVSLCSGSCFSKWSCMEHQACSYEMDARHLSQSMTAQPAPSRGHELMLIKNMLSNQRLGPVESLPTFQVRLSLLWGPHRPHFRSYEPSPPLSPPLFPFSSPSNFRTHPKYLQPKLN